MGGGGKAGRGAAGAWAWCTLEKLPFQRHTRKAGMDPWMGMDSDLTPFIGVMTLIKIMLRRMKSHEATVFCHSQYSYHTHQ